MIQLKMATTLSFRASLSGIDSFSSSLVLLEIPCMLRQNVSQFNMWNCSIPYFTPTFANRWILICFAIHSRHSRLLFMITVKVKWIKLYEINATIYLVAKEVAKDVGGNLFDRSLCITISAVKQNTWRINFSNDFVTIAGRMVRNANANNGYTSDNNWVLRLIVK